MHVKIEQYISRNRDLLCIICIIVVCTIFLSSYIFSTPTPLIFPVSDLGTDLNRDVLPNIEYMVDTIKSTGQIPLWRSYLLSGAPLVGHPSIPVFYPPNWLLFKLPLPLGLNLLALLDFSWLGIGMYLFLRFVGDKRALPSLLGAIAMAISPKWIAHLSGGHWFMLAALAWTPWTLLALDRYWISKKTSWLFLLAIALAAQAMNHLTMFVITGLTLAIVSITYLAPKTWLNWIKKMALGWSIVIILTLGLAAGQILPFLELFPYATHTIESSTFTSLNPAALLVSIFPPDFKYPEWFLFPGLVVLLFAGLSWAYGWTRFEKTWGGIGLFGLVLSLGEYTPIYFWLFGWNPLISALRVPTRWWLLVIIALVVMATSGFNHWMENGQRLNRRAKSVVSVILGVEVIAVGMKLILGEMLPFDTVTTSIVAVFLGVFLGLGHLRPRSYVPGLILLGLTVELVMVGRTLIRPQNASSTGVSAELTSQIQSNLISGERVFSPGEGFSALALVRSGIHAAEGYDAFPLANYLKFIHLATGCPLVQEATGSEEELAACLNPEVMRLDWLKLINVRLLAVQQDEGWNITELSPGLGRAFSVQQFENTSSEECLNELDAVNPQFVALVEGENQAQQNGVLRVIGQEQGVNNEIFHVMVSDSSTLLIRSENWAPGWHARVDGQPEDVLRVDCVLQGVWLQTGEHTVEFDYQPFGYPLGAWIGAGTLIGMCVWVIATFVWKKKRKTKQESL